MRDTYGSAPSVGLIRGIITKIPSSRFHPYHRRGCCWNRGHLFDTVLAGSHLESSRIFGRWSCRRYVAAHLLHDDIVLSNLCFSFSPPPHLLCYRMLGSIAAGIQSGIGNVVAGSFYAVLQGIAMGAKIPVLAPVIGAVIIGFVVLLLASWVWPESIPWTWPPSGEWTWPSSGEWAWPELGEWTWPLSVEWTWPPSVSWGWSPLDLDVPAPTPGSL